MNFFLNLIYLAAEHLLLKDKMEMKFYILNFAPEPQQCYASVNHGFQSILFFVFGQQ